MQKSTTPKHKWIPEDDAILRQMYQGDRASAQSAADLLGVTLNAIKSRVSKLGLSCRENRKAWSPQEDERLESLLEQYNAKVTAKKLGRSENSVVVRSKRLGISRRCRDSWYTKNEVCEILGRDHRWVQRRIDDGSLKASHHHKFPPAQGGSAAWHIERSDLKEFIRRHPEDLTGRNVDLIAIVDLIAGITYNTH